MAKRLCSNDIWFKDWFLELSDKQKLLIKFLYDNCDCAGIYEISYHILNMCFKDGITREDFNGLKQVRFIDDNVVFLEDFIQFQYNIELSELNPRNNVHKGILRKLSKYNLQFTEQPETENVKENMAEEEKTPSEVTEPPQIEPEPEPEEPKPEKKVDPLYDERVSTFIEEYKKYFNFVNTAQNRRLIAETVADEPLEVWVEVFKKAKDKGHLIDNRFKPLSLKSLLLNYSKILEGTYQLVINPRVQAQKRIEDTQKRIQSQRAPDVPDRLPESFIKLDAILKRRKERGM